MEASTGPQFDLSQATSWRGVRPGMTRAAVLALLPPDMVEDADDAADPEWMILTEWQMDLTFAADGEQALLQVALTDAAFHWRGQPLLGEPLPVVLERLGDRVRGAGWRPRDALDENPEDWQAATPGPFADEKLLDAGTLWLPALGLGLGLQHGVVKQLTWRGPADVPRELAGGVTAEQLAIVLRPDAAAYLQAWRPERPKPSRVWAQVCLTVVFLCVMGGMARSATQELRLWREAPHRTARLVAIDPLTASNGQKPYHLAWTGEDGPQRTVTLAAGEFYVPPRVVGEEVDVIYLATNPSEVRGPAYARNAAFVRFFPWAVAVVAAYGLLRWLLGRVGRAGNGIPARG